MSNNTIFHHFVRNLDKYNEIDHVTVDDADLTGKAHYIKAAAFE